jgi:hypothetical protein
MGCRSKWGAIASAFLLAGCGQQTTRVGDGATLQSLSQAGTGVAVMRVGAASPNCNHVQLMLGFRDGDGYRRNKLVTVANMRSLSEAPVAEIELPPGEHYIVAYNCITDKGAAVVADQVTAHLFRSSYARFNVNAGEIVNVGYLHFQATRVGTNAFGRPVRTDVQVTDWPLAELDRFKKTRPTIYAQMKTRLMTPTTGPQPEPTLDECDQFRVLLAEGKVQNLPTTCAPAPVAATSAGKAKVMAGR